MAHCSLVHRQTPAISFQWRERAGSWRLRPHSPPPRSSSFRSLIPDNQFPISIPVSLSHVNEQNQAAMVDVSAKEITVRIATAEARVTVNDAVAAQFDGRD